MQAELTKLLTEKKGNLNHQLLIWATDELIYHKVTDTLPLVPNKQILLFRLFNETEEYFGFTRKGVSRVRHISDTAANQPFIEKVVKLKGNMAQLIAPHTTKDLMLKSRDYLAYKPNGQAYYTDSRMVSIDELKLINHE